MAPTMSGPSYLPSTNKSSASTAPKHENYEDAMSRPATSSGRMIGPPWTGTSPYTAATPSNNQEYRPRSPQGSLPIKSGQYMVLQPVTSYTGNTEEGWSRNNATWRLPYMLSPYKWETDLTWTALTSNEFDTFNYDEETFGGYTTGSPWDYPSYTEALQYPFRLSDSPPHQV
ncbi:hypothetical protein ARMSODRAFT_1012830 [Armillaria solidipes]|uniref:Uncharacterized protein n=1 Tax=Armillaria solidipes TaxID=1076256 RepID=A0A2H3CF28_9AGAR|nr:hypothetical protein ARMSODRAFT_1012830 [Armillaria solidipes]